MPRTYLVGVRVDFEDERRARAALKDAGLFVQPSIDEAWSATMPVGKVLVEVTSLGEDGEGGAELVEAVVAALHAAGVPFEHNHTSQTLSGGSVNNRWGRVLVDGVEVDLNGGPLKVMTGPGVDVEGQLASLAQALGVEPARLSVIVPDDVPPNT